MSFEFISNLLTRSVQSIMSETNEKNLLPHHEQQPLCMTRLPYRQGRTHTAVKVYSINNESNHLLVFGVPALKLRQETKALFSKFGKLTQFIISSHKGESFTETYHATYERIQSARMAKKMLDTNNFYGGSLHVCYAPEFETIEETRQKLMKRQRDVLYKLKQLQNENNKAVSIENSNNNADVVSNDSVYNSEVVKPDNVPKHKMNMGEINMINIENNVEVLNRKRKSLNTSIVIEKKFRPCFLSENNSDIKIANSNNKTENYDDKSSNNVPNEDNIEIVDCTSTETETITNINDTLNYKNFGNEVIRNIPQKTVNRIQFCLNNKKL